MYLGDTLLNLTNANMSNSAVKTYLSFLLFIFCSFLFLPANNLNAAVTNSTNNATTSVSTKASKKQDKLLKRIKKKLDAGDKTKAHKQGIWSAILGTTAFLLLFSSVGFIAISGVTFGVLALLLSLLFSIPALLLGMSAVRKCADDPEKRGKKLGRLGTILGGIILGLAIVVVLMAVGVIDLS